MPATSRFLSALAGLALAILLLVPAAQGHGVVEAQELEVHVLNDEGSDVIEMYGGYDITDVLLGSAHLSEQGDTVYVRLELYGLIQDQTALMPWTVRVTYDGPDGPGAHFLSTSDGANFEHDFLKMDWEFDEGERTLHVQRAYLTSGGPVPGQPVRNLRVESFWGEDLRDVAPGGIPAPGSNGALEYPDPTQIDGRGVLVETPVPPATDAYFGAVTATRAGTLYTLNVTNGLTLGGQHVVLSFLDPDTPVWTQRLDVAEQVLAANGTGTFVFEAAPQEASAMPVLMQLSSDVGGRLVLEVRPDSSVHARGEEVLQPSPPAQGEESPAPVAGLAALAVLGVAGLRRRL